MGSQALPPNRFAWRRAFPIGKYAVEVVAGPVVALGAANVEDVGVGVAVVPTVDLVVDPVVAWAAVVVLVVLGVVMVMKSRVRCEYAVVNLMSSGGYLEDCSE